jgi:hypothetical protein
MMMVMRMRMMMIVVMDDDDEYDNVGLGDDDDDDDDDDNHHGALPAKDGAALDIIGVLAPMRAGPVRQLNRRGDRVLDVHLRETEHTVMIG